MNQIDTARDRLQQADGLAAVLDAAYCAFESMLSIVEAHEDPADDMFVPLVMAAASVADGRDVIALAPSLPPHRLHPEVPVGEPEAAAGVAVVARAVGRVSEQLVVRLEDAARSAHDRGDRDACLAAARWAREVHALLAGNEP